MLPIFLLAKKVFGILFILFGSGLICQNKKRPGFCTLTEIRFIKTLRSKQDKKIPSTLLQTLVIRKRVQKFSEKILNSMVVGTRQSFQFFRQITCFLENNRALSKFKWWILYYLISIIKLQNNQRATLNKETFVAHDL